MEAIETSSVVEAAVIWQAQTILANLLVDKLEAWLRQAGLADSADKLRIEIERVEMVVSDRKGRVIGSRPLARSLARLKELLYDADDMVDELDYYRLKHQVEEVTAACTVKHESTTGDGGETVAESRANANSNAGMPSSSNLKLRSEAWKDFRITDALDGRPLKAECIHCGTTIQCETTNGTSVLRRHSKSESCKRKRAAIEHTPNPSRATDCAQNDANVLAHGSDNRKGVRIGDASAQNPAADMNPWNKLKFCDRVQQMTHRLQETITEVEKRYRLNSVLCPNPYRNATPDPCQRTSSIVHHEMYGRVAEKNIILKLMTEDKSDDVLVLPIVGIGGIGKTALAQHLYNDRVVKRLFEQRIWVWVSNSFDVLRLTREMLDFVSEQKYEGLSSLAKLQEVLMSHVTSKKFLLILDDVCDNMDDGTWNKLLAPLKIDNVKGSVILVTTRKLCIAKRISKVEPIKLGALQTDDFWLLLKSCAFGDDNYAEHPSLNMIGHQIAEKLHGNPLAAETAGMLLRRDWTIDHWSSILENETWKSLDLNKGDAYFEA